MTIAIVLLSLLHLRFGEWQDISAGGVCGEVRFCDKPAAWRIRAVEEAPSGLLLDRDGSLIV